MVKREGRDNEKKTVIEKILAMGMSLMLLTVALEPQIIMAGDEIAINGMDISFAEKNDEMPYHISDFDQSMALKDQQDKLINKLPMDSKLEAELQEQAEIQKEFEEGYKEYLIEQDKQERHCF